MRDTKYCAGCDSNFYNGNNPMGVQECWMLEKAKIVKKWAIGWWVPMNKKENFRKVITYSCHTESGQVAFLDKLPEHLQTG